MEVWGSENWEAREEHELTVRIVGRSVPYEWEEAEILGEWDESCSIPISSILMVSASIDILTSSNLNTQSSISPEIKITICSYP